MTDNQERQTRGLVAWVKEISALVTAAGIVLSFVWVVASVALRPYLEPYLLLPEKMSALAAAVDRLSQRVPVVDSVEFQGVAIAYPAEVRAGDRVRITYNLRRNINCEGLFIDRFHSVELAAIDPQYTTEPLKLARRPVTSDFSTWSRVLVIPELPPGVWALTPEIEPGGACAGSKNIYPPFAYFTVIE